MKNLAVSPPHEGKFANCAARGITLRCEDGQAVGQTGRVYVVTGPNFSASCIVQNSDANAENVLPRVKKILDSIRPLVPRQDR